MPDNTSNIPTGRTYLGFALAWTVLLFFVYLICIALFAAGRWEIGLLTILLTGSGFVQHIVRLGRRAKRGLVRRR